MIETKWTRGGLMIETTDTCHGMLVQGGVSGRVEWYSHATLAKLGIDRGDDLSAPVNDYGTTTLSWLRHHRQPDRVLKAGHEIL